MEHVNIGCHLLSSELYIVFYVSIVYYMYTQCQDYNLNYWIFSKDTLFSYSLHVSHVCNIFVAFSPAEK